MDTNDPNALYFLFVGGIMFINGDIVRTKRWKLYYHYGVFSDGKVIAFSHYPDNWWNSKISIRQVEISEFTKFGSPAMVYFRAMDMVCAEAIVDYAYSMIGFQGYSLLHYNCKTFVDDCVYHIEK